MYDDDMVEMNLEEDYSDDGIIIVEISEEEDENCGLQELVF